MTHPTEDRAALRARLRALRRAVPAVERAAAARAVARHVSHTHWLAPGRRVALYLPMREELDCTPLIALARRRVCEIFVPRIDRRRHGHMHLYPLGAELVANRFGIAEPAAGEPLDPRWIHVVFAPLVGFDRRGARLGMGAGYYDRLLAFRRLRRAWRGPRLVGLAYHFQEIARLPLASHDVALDAVVTEHGVIDCTGATT